MGRSFRGTVSVRIALATGERRERSGICGRVVVGGGAVRAACGSVTGRWRQRARRCTERSARAAAQRRARAFASVSAQALTVVSQSCCEDAMSASDSSPLRPERTRCSAAPQATCSRGHSPQCCPGSAATWRAREDVPTCWPGATGAGCKGHARRGKKERGRQGALARRQLSAVERALSLSLEREREREMSRRR
ncbi:hypothetical protein N9L68_05765 [bacterium]|nr:hypothetical protein [bacterium]